MMNYNKKVTHTEQIAEDDDEQRRREADYDGAQRPRGHPLPFRCLQGQHSKERQARNFGSIVVFQRLKKISKHSYLYTLGYILCMYIMIFFSLNVHTRDYLHYCFRPAKSMLRLS